jgi:hypothetical protein
MPTRKNSAVRYTPTPREIKQELARIRATWTEAQWRKRSGDTPAAEQWVPPIVNTEDFQDEAPPDDAS